MTSNNRAPSEEEKINFRFHYEPKVSLVTTRRSDLAASRSPCIISISINYRLENKWLSCHVRASNCTVDTISVGGGAARDTPDLTWQGWTTPGRPCQQQVEQTVAWPRLHRRQHRRRIKKKRLRPSDFDLLIYMQNYLNTWIIALYVANLRKKYENEIPTSEQKLMRNCCDLLLHIYYLNLKSKQ